MINPYVFELNGLNIIIYSENKEKSTEIFNQKIEEYNQKIRYEERHIIMDILDSANDSENAMYLLGQYLISQELKNEKDKNK